MMYLCSRVNIQNIQFIFNVKQLSISPLLNIPLKFVFGITLGGKKFRLSYRFEVIIPAIIKKNLDFSKNNYFSIVAVNTLVLAPNFSSQYQMR